MVSYQLGQNILFEVKFLYTGQIKKFLRQLAKLTIIQVEIGMSFGLSFPNFFIYRLTH